MMRRFILLFFNLLLWLNFYSQSVFYSDGSVLNFLKSGEYFYVSFRVSQDEIRIFKLSDKLELLDSLIFKASDFINLYVFDIDDNNRMHILLSFLGDFYINDKKVLSSLEEEHLVLDMRDLRFKSGIILSDRVTSKIDRVKYDSIYYIWNDSVLYEINNKGEIISVRSDFYPSNLWKVGSKELLYYDLEEKSVFRFGRHELLMSYTNSLLLKDLVKLGEYFIIGFSFNGEVIVSDSISFISRGGFDNLILVVDTMLTIKSILHQGSQGNDYLYDIGRSGNLIYLLSSFTKDSIREYEFSLLSPALEPVFVRRGNNLYKQTLIYYGDFNTIYNVIEFNDSLYFKDKLIKVHGTGSLIYSVDYDNNFLEDMEFGFVRSVYRASEYTLSHQNYFSNRELKTFNSEEGINTYIFPQVSASSERSLYIDKFIAGDLYVYDSYGRQIFSKKITGNREIIILPESFRGVFWVVIISKDNSIITTLSGIKY